MRAISVNRKAVREALGREGWRFALTDTLGEFRKHRDSCRTVWLPVGGESENRTRSLREQLVRQLPWELRGQSFPRWLSYISAASRKRLQPHLPMAAEFCLTHGFIFLVAEFCLTHGFIFLVGEVWGERVRGRWRIHRADGPAIALKDREFYFWRGWQVSKKTLILQPTAGRILAETNQTEREVLLERMGVENFVREAHLEPADSFRESTLLKVATSERQHLWRNGRSEEAPVSLAFLKVICPSTQNVYFLRVNPDVETAKEALESTLPGHRRDWEKDLVAET